MILDGLRALFTGNYTSLKGGRLGPWAALVSAVGINPLSTGMKWLYVVYGLLWLVITICFSVGLRWARAIMLIAAIGMLWFLPFGTLFSLLQIILLLYKVRD